MAQIHHFEHGWLTPTLSYTLSVLGSLLGLVCAGRLRTAPSAGLTARAVDGLGYGVTKRLGVTPSSRLKAAPSG